MVQHLYPLHGWWTAISLCQYTYKAKERETLRMSLAQSKRTKENWRQRQRMRRTLGRTTMANDGVAAANQITGLRPGTRTRSILAFVSNSTFRNVLQLGKHFHAQPKAVATHCFRTSDERACSQTHVRRACPVHVGISFAAPASQSLPLLDHS